MKSKLILVLSISVLMSCEVSKYASAMYTAEGEKQINVVMNKWHEDVIKHDLESYFEVTDDSFIFLGTDPKERWTKDEFYKFCKPYFDKKTTWSFTPLWRNVYFSEDGKTAWFEEQLTTWMEECRGSGVLVYKNNEWKLVHYNLTVLIENEKVKSFIELRKE
jgi:hypothetical protein